MIKPISSGEIVKQIYVTPYEALELKKTQARSGIFGFTGGEEELEAEEISTNPLDKYEWNLSPWFKGVPFKVIEVAGPMVALQNIGFPNLSKVLLIDARFTKFMEVEKEYYDNYWAAMGVKVI